MFPSGGNEGSGLFADIPDQGGSTLFSLTNTTPSTHSTLFSSTLSATATQSPIPIAQPDPASFSSDHTTSREVSLANQLAASGSTIRRSPTSWPAIKLSRLPVGFNRKKWLYQYFERFGRVIRIICQPSLDSAYIAFDSVLSAQNAKRHGHEPPPNSMEILPSVVLISSAKCRSRIKDDIEKSKAMYTEIIPQLGSDQESMFECTDDSSVNTPFDLCNRHSLEKSKPDIQDFKHPAVNRTVEERATVLQAHYATQRQWRSSVIPVSRMSTNASALDFAQLDSSAPEDCFDTSGGAMRGTCMDMCPELERYLREVHHRVSIFECISSTLGSHSSGWQMDHTRAVKDYERSSADQPFPLPCELRPTAVLERTMAYLLASIADRPELDTNRNLWKPWYEFMWTRTRAIRKDVAQQRLCCPIIVGVMERIARFHIFCAARLVDQPIDSFDPRINSENLTQCLQTLNEMYTDLGDGEPTKCINEAEFRAYMILMKLNDQSALSAVQKLPTHILRSTEVRFAVNVHEALTTNNYIRFFRLAISADCLTSCLMHRYFIQVRNQALARLSAAFAGHPKREIQYPLTTLTKQLGFEDNQETKSFCEWWGLTVENDHVIFKKQTSFDYPKLAWRERRSHKLIEVKRRGIPLSTLFNKGPINPEDALPLPVHSSFDSNDLFVDSTTINDQLRDVSVRVPQPLSPEVPQDLDAAEINTSKSDMPQSIPSSIEDFLEVWIAENIDFYSVAYEIVVMELVADNLLEDLWEEVVEDECFRIARQLLQHQSIRMCVAFEIEEALLREYIEQNCRPLVCHCIASSLVLMELVDTDLLPSVIRSEAQGCWFSSSADQFRRHSLLRSSLRHLLQLLRRRLREKDERDMVRSMPACPDTRLNALDIVGSKAWLLFHSSKDSNSVNKKARFSHWADEVDEKVTWQPLSLCPELANRVVGLFVSHRLCEHSRSYSILLRWLECKLAAFHILFISELSDVGQLNSLSAIISLGFPSQSPLEQLNQIQLPILVLIGPAPHSTNLPQDHEHTLVLSLSDRCGLTPTSSWSSVLQTGLDWLSAHIQPSIRTTECCNKLPSVLPSPMPSALIRNLLEAHFLYPLANLSKLWRNQGLIDPSFQSLFSAYHMVITQLSGHIKEESDCHQLRSVLVIPQAAIDLLVAPTWDLLQSSWVRFSEDVQLAFSNTLLGQAALDRTKSNFVTSYSCLPPPRLAPSVYLCMLVVHDRLSHLENLFTVKEPHSRWELPDSLIRLCKNDGDIINLDLGNHFYEVGEPCLSKAAVIEQLIEERRRSQIINTLQHSTSQTSPDGTDSDLLSRLESLSGKMTIIENSLDEILSETNASYRSTSSEPPRTCQ